MLTKVVRASSKRTRTEEVNRAALSVEAAEVKEETNEYTCSFARMSRNSEQTRSLQFSPHSAVLNGPANRKNSYTICPQSNIQIG